METLNTRKDYILEDQKVLLRPLEEIDYDNLLPFSLLEPNLWKYSLAQASTPELLKKYIQDALHARDKGHQYPFVVFDKISNQYAGCTRFYDIQMRDLSIQLGYTWYGSKYHGSGLNNHCKRLLLGFAFDTLGFQRVELRADFENKRSIAAMKKIGCIEEGIVRSHALKPDGSRRDSIILSILKPEWTNEVKGKLDALVNAT